ncbi:unnamed protein product [Gadus morhua 'NCC']
MLFGGCPPGAERRRPQTPPPGPLWTPQIRHRPMVLCKSLWFCGWPRRGASGAAFPDPGELQGSWSSAGMEALVPASDPTNRPHRMAVFLPILISFLMDKTPRLPPLRIAASS